MYLHIDLICDVSGEDAAVCEQLLLDAPRELFVIAAWPAP